MPQPIRGLLLLVITTSAFCGATACQGRQATPPEVDRAYRALVRSLDPQHPGLSAAQLRAFARANAGYEIAVTADAEIARWRGRLDTAYKQARDLVRQDQFDRAEAILQDLAKAPDERAGRLAREYLAFDFPQAKATRLLQKGDTAGAEHVARSMRDGPLTDDQLVTTERLLDTATTVGIAQTMTRATALKSAARMLQVSLLSAYADDGQYPASLGPDSPVLAAVRDGGSFNSAVGAIEGYAATRDTFSLVVVGKDPRQRIRVTESTIEDVSAVVPR